MELKELLEKSLAELRAMGEELGIPDAIKKKREYLAVAIASRTHGEEETEKGGGILEIMPEGIGFLRENYHMSKNDIYISQAQLRRFHLRNGDLVFPVAFVDPAGIGYVMHHRGPRVQLFEELVRAYLVARLVSLNIQQRHWGIARICSIGDRIVKVIIKQNWTVAGFH